VRRLPSDRLGTLSDPVPLNGNSQGLLHIRQKLAPLASVVRPSKQSRRSTLHNSGDILFNTVKKFIDGLWTEVKSRMDFLVSSPPEAPDPIINL
jgi:hypothetical protein